MDFKAHLIVCSCGKWPNHSSQEYNNENKALSERAEFFPLFSFEWIRRQVVVSSTLFAVGVDTLLAVSSIFDALFLEAWAIMILFTKALRTRWALCIFAESFEAVVMDNTDIFNLSSSQLKLPYDKVWSKHYRLSIFDAEDMLEKHYGVVFETAEESAVNLNDPLTATTQIASDKFL